MNKIYAGDKKSFGGSGGSMTYFATQADADTFYNGKNMTSGATIIVGSNPSIILQYTENGIYDNTKWTDITSQVAITIKGDKGDTGAAGATGAQGVQGDKGDDGREIVLRVQNDVLQWQYIGDTVWIDLYTFTGGIVYNETDPLYMADKPNIATKAELAELEAKIGTAINIKSPVPTETDLFNITDMEVGDMREVKETGIFYIFTDEGWEATGGLTDLTEVNKSIDELKEEIDNALPQMVNESLFPAATGDTMTLSISFSGDTTGSEYNCILVGTGTLTGSYDSGANMTTYLQSLPQSDVADGKRKIFMLTKGSVLVWEKNYSAADFGIFASADASKFDFPQIVTELTTVDSVNTDTGRITLTFTGDTTTDYKFYFTNQELTGSYLMGNTSYFTTFPMSLFDGATTAVNISFGTTDNVMLLYKNYKKTDFIISTNSADKTSDFVSPITDTNKGITQTDMGEKANIYNLPNPTILQVPLNTPLYGKTIQLIGQDEKVPAPPHAFITFSDGSYIGSVEAVSGSYGIFDATGKLIQRFNQAWNYWDYTSYTIPDGLSIVSIADDAADYQVPSMSIIYDTGTSYNATQKIDVVDVYNGLQDLEREKDNFINLSSEIDALNTTVNVKHIPTDRFRWQDSYDTTLELGLEAVFSQGLKPDTNVYNITQGSVYPINSTYGGYITVQAQNDDDNFATVERVGKSDWSSEGEAAGSLITKYFRVRNGDAYTINGAVSATFTPFVPDPNTPISIVYNQNQEQAAQIVKLQTDILNINARLDNLQPDTDNTAVIVDNDNSIDITSGGQYTVNSTLGGQLTGSGITTLGLLGLKVIATGIVDITLSSDRTINNIKYTSGQSVRVYDNTALLGASVPDLVIDVKNGDVITTSGMKILKLTPYKAAQ